MGKGNASSFSDDQMSIYKECFRLMDVDKDGVINKVDLRAAFDNVGEGASQLLLLLLLFSLRVIFT